MARRRKSKKKKTHDIYVNGELFNIKELQRRMRANGEDPKTYRKHPDYVEYFRLVRERHKEIAAIRRKKLEDGEVDPRTPLTKHPNADAFGTLRHEQDFIVQGKVRKGIINTLDTMESLKMLAKSKIDYRLLMKARKSNHLLKGEVDHLDLGMLKEITNIILMANKAQLEAANKYLGANAQESVKKAVEKSINTKNNKNSFDFGKLKEEEQVLEKMSSGDENDLIKGFDKLFN